MDYCFFKEDTFYNTAFNNKIDGIGNIDNINTVVFGKHFYNNSIGGGFSNNSIDNYFRKNDIKNQTCDSIDFSTATHVYGDYDTTILKRADGTVVLTYYNNSANLVMVDVNS